MRPSNADIHEPNSNGDSLVDRLLLFEATLTSGVTRQKSLPDDVSEQDRQRYSDGCKALVALREAFQEDTPPDDEATPQTLGDFRIIREIGRGGMGVVYEAEQISLARRVALKVLPFAALVEPRLLQRFKLESQAAAGLHHQHIAPVYSVGTDRGVHFYAMQYIDGCTLAETVGVVADPSDETLKNAAAELSTLRSTSPKAFFRHVASLIADAAEALHYAHTRGVVHRDVKPSNLMLDSEGKLWVTDFGLAQVSDQDGLTMSGDILGTLRYMSPEQASPDHTLVDQRTDIYSLGATLFEVLTRQPLHDGVGRRELLAQLHNEATKLPRTIDLRIPHDLETIVLKAVQYEAADRYRTSQEMAEDLRRFVSDQPVQAKRPTVVRLVQRWAQRNAVRLLTASCILVAAMAAVGGAGMVAIDRAAEADEQRALAEQQRSTAIDERNTAQKNLYYAEMTAGQHDIADSNPGGVYGDLLKYLPTEGHDEMRGWEWYYLLSQCRTEQTTLYARGRFGGSSIAWSPDGRYLGTPATIWDADLRQPHRSLSGRDNDVCAGWSSDGSQFAWAAGHEIYVRGAEGKVRRVANYLGGVHCLCWHPDGSQIAAGGRHPVMIYDVKSGELVKSLPIAPDRSKFKVVSLDWSPNGELLAVQKQWDGLEVWNLTTVELAWDKQHGGRRQEFAWHPDGSRFATRQGWAFQIFASDTWELEKDSELFGYGTLAYSPDGSQIAVTANEVAQIWDERGEEKLQEFVGHDTEIVSVAWRPDGRQLATIAEDGVIKIWDLDEASLPAVVAAGADSETLEWIDDRTLEMKSVSGQRSTVSRHTTGGELVKEIQLESSQDVSLSADETMKMVNQIDRGNDRRPALLSPDSRLLAVYDEEPHAIRILNAATGEQRAELRLDPAHYLLQFAFSRNGQWLVIQTETGPDETHCIETWSTETGRPVWRWQLQMPDGHKNGVLPVLRLVWNHADSGFAGVGRGDPVDNTIWWSFHLHVFDHDQQSRTMLYPSQTGPKGVALVAWSPSDRHIAMGTYLGYVEVVDAKTRKLIFAEKVHRKDITALRWSPDERRLCVASRDGSVKIITADSGKTLLDLKLEEGYAKQVAWSPNGQCLAALTDDEAVMWDASRGYAMAHPKKSRSSEHAFLYYDLAERAEGDVRKQALRRFTQLVPDTIATWRKRADVFIELDEYQRAAEEYSKLLQNLEKPPFIDELSRLCCVLGSEDRPRYDALAAPLIDQAVADPEVGFLGDRAIIASLGGSKLQARAMANLLMKINADGDSHLERQLGACLWRSGAFEEAIDVLTAYVTALEGQSGVEYELAFARYVLAASHWSSGHRQQARQLLTEANGSANVYLKAGHHTSWIGRVILRTLRNDAVAVIENTTSSAD